MGNVDNWGLKVGLLGASSSASFMHSIFQAVEGSDMPEPDRLARLIASSHTSGLTPYGKRAQNANVQNTEYFLPPRKTANRLLAVHWTLSQCIFPWVDRLRFMRWYEGLWTGREDTDRHVDEQVYHCILNTIFATSYKLDTSLNASDQETMSNTHFQRAQKLFCLDLMDVSHIELVQALLLMGQYLQSTHMSRRCFQCIGLAIWIAQDMGLHIPETLSLIKSQHDREMARRTWHGCILMDRITSMTFGRPTRISQASALQSPLPTVMDDEYFDTAGPGTGKQPEHQPSIMSFFVAYCRLHLILGDILSAFYVPRTPDEPNLPDRLHHSGSAGKQNIDKILQYEKALATWRSSLEVPLQIDSDFSDPTETCIFRRQAVILYARFLYIRMLLFRPFFSKPSEAPAASTSSRDIALGRPLADAITSHALGSCVKTAQQLLDLISTHMRSSKNEPDLLPPWWHVISYVYTAGTIVVAAHLFPSVLDQISISSLTKSIRQGFGILQEYEHSKKSGQRCKASLAALYEKIVSPASRRHSPNGNLMTPDLSAMNGNLDFDYPANFVADTSSLDLFDGTDLFWLNSAAFDPGDHLWH